MNRRTPLAFLLALAAVAAAATVPPRVAAQESPALPEMLLEDFETATIGARPYFWKEAKQGTQMATIGGEAYELDGDRGNKALKFEYQFSATFDAAHGLESGPMTQALPGGMTGIELSVHGDNSRNLLGVRIKDRFGETFEWRQPINWMGWKKSAIQFNAATAIKSTGSRSNGVIDPPLQLEAVRIARAQAGQRRGATMIDNLVALVKYDAVTKLYDVADGVHPELWRASRNRATIGLLADSLVPQNGKDLPALKMEYEYENGDDSSVEFQRVIPAGEGHGTLIAEVFGDGSNNILRFRMLDGAGKLWQATWASVLVDWSGWKTLYLDTRTLREVNGLDPSAMMEKFPIQFQGILLDDCSASDALPGVESGRKGEIYLGRLLYCTTK